MCNENKKVYKYVDITKHLYDNLKNDSIAFTHIDLLNDPFEGFAKCKVLVDESGEWKDSVIPKMLNAKVQEGKYKKTYNTCRLFCVTEDPYSPLMWAHYANNHKGVCLEYNLEDIRAMSDKVSKMEYVSEIPSFDTVFSELSNAIFFKSDLWSYEREIRAVCFLTDKDCKFLNYDENYDLLQLDNDKEYRYFTQGRKNMDNLRIVKAPNVMIKNCKTTGIYLGLKTEKKHKDKLMDVAKRKDIPVYQIFMSKSGYALKSRLQEKNKEEL